MFHELVDKANNRLLINYALFSLQERCEQFARRLDAIDAWRLTPRESVDLSVLKYDIKSYIDGYQWRL